MEKPTLLLLGLGAFALTFFAYYKVQPRDAAESSHPSGGMVAIADPSSASETPVISAAGDSATPLTIDLKDSALLLDAATNSGRYVGSIHAPIADLFGLSPEQIAKYDAAVEAGLEELGTLEAQRFQVVTAEDGTLVVEVEPYAERAQSVHREVQNASKQYLGAAEDAVSKDQKHLVDDIYDSGKYPTRYTLTHTGASYMISTYRSFPHSPDLPDSWTRVGAKVLSSSMLPKWEHRFGFVFQALMPQLEVSNGSH